MKGPTVGALATSPTDRGRCEPKDFVASGGLLTAATIGLATQPRTRQQDDSPQLGTLGITKRPGSHRSPPTLIGQIAARRPRSFRKPDSRVGFGALRLPVGRVLMNGISSNLARGVIPFMAKAIILVAGVPHPGWSDHLGPLDVCPWRS